MHALTQKMRELGEWDKIDFDDELEQLEDEAWQSADWDPEVCPPPTPHGSYVWAVVCTGVSANMRSVACGAEALEHS